MTSNDAAKQFPVAFSNCVAMTASNNRETHLEYAAQCYFTNTTYRVIQYAYNAPSTWIAIGYQLNGLLIQWGTSKSQEVKIAAYTSKDTYQVFSHVGRNDNYAHYDNEEYYIASESKIYRPRQLDHMISFLTIGYQLNGLLIQWGENNGAEDAYVDVPLNINFTTTKYFFTTTSTTPRTGSAHIDIKTRYENKVNVYCNLTKTFGWLAIGYQLNGLLIQWGTVSQDTEELLISFFSYTSEKTYVIVALKNSGTGTGSSDNDVRVYNKSKGSCEFYSSRKLPVEWIAIGY